MQVQDILERVVLKPEEIKKLIEEKQEELTPEAAAEIMCDIIENSGACESASPIDKMLYITAQAYLKGFTLALYRSNEAMRESLKAIGEGA